MPNLYATLDQIKAQLGIAATTDDALLLVLLEAASRRVDDFCQRHFNTVLALIEHQTEDPYSILLRDDLLSLTALASDDDGDGTAETDWELTDVDFWPPDSPVKWKAQPALSSELHFPKAPYVSELIGIWGYGDGEHAAPWTPTGITVTLADAAVLTGSASEAGLAAGMTILVGTEQIYIEAVTVVT